MKENDISTRFSNNYTNEEIAFSIGKIARENFAIKHPDNNKPKRISRRDLVGLLNENHKNLNLPDTLEVNELIKLSYEINSSVVREAIVETIKENIGNDSVYNPKRIYPSNHVSQFSSKEKDRQTAKCSLLKANASVIDNEAAKTKIDTVLETTRKLEFKKNVFGIDNADNAKKYAHNVLSGYESMIEEYDKIKNINLNLLNDFHILRNELKSEREDIVQLIIDLIGDRAKREFPELFDFSQIEWLKFEESWEKLNLSYNKINDNHQEFSDAVDLALNEFGNTVSTESSVVWKNLSSTSKKRNLNQGDLIGAGAQMAVAAGVSAIKGAINTRNKSKEVVAIIQRDVEILKQEMSQDNNRIVADIFRLGKIYSKLSHSYLPNYSEYIKNNSDLVVSELEPLYEKIIQNPVIYKAKEENNQLIKRQRFLNQKIIDFNNNLEYSIKEEIRFGKILEFKRNEYEIVESLMPKKPFILIEIFTFGRSTKIFEATMNEWITFCKPVIDDYNYITELQNDEINKRNSIKVSISECENELSSLTNQIRSNSEIVMTEFNKDPISQKEMVKLINVVKKIINASRNVLEVELDQELQEETVVCKLKENIVLNKNETYLDIKVNEIKQVIIDVDDIVYEVKEKITKVDAKINQITEGLPSGNEIDEVKKKLNIRVNKIEVVGEEVKAVIEDFGTRVKLSKSVIAAYTDFKTEHENGQLHKITYKLENSLNEYLDKNADSETKLISKIESHLSNLPLPKSIDASKAANYRNELAKLGLATLRVELKVFNINQETNSLKKGNQINENELADKIFNYAKDLKKNIELDKANHEAVKTALSDNSLEGLQKAAKLINPNAKDYNENLDQEVEDFLKGGDLKL